MTASLVEYPLKNLDLSDVTIGPQEVKPIYDLYAVSIHLGGYGGGHYVSFCLHNNQWYLFDDSNVSVSSESSVKNNPNAYVLFYKLRKKWVVFFFSFPCSCYLFNKFIDSNENLLLTPLIKGFFQSTNLSLIKIELMLNKSDINKIFGSLN